MPATAATRYSFPVPSFSWISASKHSTNSASGDGRSAVPFAMFVAASPKSLLAWSQDPAATGMFGDRRITGPSGVGRLGPASRNSISAAMNSVLAEPFGHTISTRCTM